MKLFKTKEKEEIKEKIQEDEGVDTPMVNASDSFTEEKPVEKKEATPSEDKLQIELTQESLLALINGLENSENLKLFLKVLAGQNEYTQIQELYKLIEQ